MGFFRSAKPEAAISALPENIPQHVAIIMDGNGRWAKNRGLPRTLGHRKGAETLRDILDGCAEIGVRYLTIYAFSSENWQRPEAEVSELMQLLREYLRKEVENLHRNGIRLRIIGDRTRMAPDICDHIAQAEALTADNQRFHLNVALNYGGRQEIVAAVRALAKDVESGMLKAEAITESLLDAKLGTTGMPEPDLLIRTGGDQRLSNFLLWQSAYTELYFTPVLWPDFTRPHLTEAVQAYASRERRYGKCHA